LSRAAAAISALKPPPTEQNILFFILPFIPFIAVNGCALTALAVKRGRKWRPAPDTPETPSAGTEVLQVVKDLFLSKPRSEEEEKTGRELQRVSVGLAVAGAGVFFFPLQLVGVAFVYPVASGIWKEGYRNLRDEHRVTSDVLTMALLVGAMFGGFFTTINLGAWFVVFVRWLALKTEAHSKQGIIDLFGQQARSAWLVVGGVEIETPVERIQVGDLISVQAGQIVPLDGVIEEGYASIDQHTLTGEAQPSEKGPGDSVFATTLAISGKIQVRVEKAGEATTAAEIGRILTDTSRFKEDLVSEATAFNDKMALPFLVLGAGCLPFVGLSSALSVLQATPGYRMVLYGPLSMLSFLHVAAKSGILIKDGRALEWIEKVDTVVFDKTGTLTVEQPHVRDVHACAGFTADAVLGYAAMAEAKQSHPIARAILDEAAARGIEADLSSDVEYEIGYGISASRDGVTVRVGSGRYLRLQEMEIPAEIEALEQEVHRAGDSIVLVAVDQKIAGAVVLRPTVRAEARDVVSRLRRRGLRLYLMSGDHDLPTRRLAQDLELDGYFAEVLPGGKSDLVKKLQAEGRKVCFVGDGINDAIALRSADVSVSLHGATTIAVDTAQIVFMSGDLTQLPQLFELATEFKANIRANFLAATVPSIAIVFGALFMGLGFLPSLILYQVSVPFAVYNTVRPLLADRKQIPAE